jgi:hypothetical protein
MELDELKGAWAQYDKKLSENLKVNEELLRKMNLNSSRHELQKPLLYEFGNVIMLFLILVYGVSMLMRFYAEPKFCVPACIAILVCIIGLISTIIKVNRFLNIDYYGSSIMKLQRDVVLLNKLVLRYRKYELSILPLFILPLLPLLFKSIHNIDLYHNIKLFAIDTIVILVISYPVTFWINKQLYDKKFKNAERLLAELDKFEKDE